MSRRASILKAIVAHLEKTGSSEIPNTDYTYKVKLDKKRVKRGLGLQAQTKNNDISVFVRGGREIYQYHTNRTTHANLSCSIAVYVNLPKADEVLDKVVSDIEHIVYEGMQTVTEHGVTKLEISDIDFLPTIKDTEGIAVIKLNLEYILEQI